MGRLITYIGSLSIAFNLFVTAALSQESPFILGPGAAWRYHASEVDPGEDWMTVTYSDQDWLIGRPGFGYGDDDDSTVLEDMEGKYQSIYIRREFNLPAIPKKIYLYVYYDDAFVAYVNGKEVKRMGIKETKIESHEASGFEIFKLDTKDFVEGRNVLAIQGVNREIDSTDFSLWPLLATTRKALSN
jgi:hypothetical protein